MPFVVVNTSQGNAVVADKVELAATWTSRLKGLLGRDALPEGAGLHIDPCNSIHMFFMRFPIDVAFLDPSGKVVRAIHSIKPWRATKVYFDAHSALELPAGTLVRTGVHEGDVLRFDPKTAVESQA
ncbi:MAG TPA: DUF192 domain-containing protein [Myxococcales bacterium]|jgi:hypothetical protein